MRQCDADDFRDPGFGPLFEGKGKDPFSASPFPPTPAERHLGELIARSFRGRSSPASIQRLRSLTGRKEREIKAMIERLRCDHRMRIGARRTSPVGYFLIVDAQDAEEALKPYRGQVFTMLRTIRALANPQMWLEFRGQLRIELEGGDE